MLQAKEGKMPQADWLPSEVRSWRRRGREVVGERRWWGRGGGGRDAGDCVAALPTACSILFTELHAARLLADSSGR
eukprot:747079-Hanusia_phi.AAC.1